MMHIKKHNKIIKNKIRFLEKNTFIYLSKNINLIKFIIKDLLKKLKHFFLL